MKRFIFVSFAFLAAAFYQMSGGADFEPRVEKIERAATIQVTEAQSVSKPGQVQAASLIARPAVASSDTERQIGSTPVALVQPSKPVVESAVARVQAVPAMTDTHSFAEPLVLASLDQGLAGLATTALAPAPTPKPVAVVADPADIREITATRVNMRDGPGTTYPILARLSFGHEVEVLDAPGNGWLRLRTLPGERTGWISASLVSKASR